MPIALTWPPRPWPSWWHPIWEVTGEAFEKTTITLNEGGE